MTNEGIAAFALIVLVYASLSGRLQRTPFTAPMLFAGIGLLLGADGLGLLDGAVSTSVLHGVTNTTLVAVLFADAAQLDPSTLRREVGVPARLLGIGLPLTIVAGAVVARLVLPSLLPAEALVLAIILAPTDAALGQAVVIDPRLPSRIRQGLNTESGLNDGICVPLLAVALAIADVADAGGVGHTVLTELVKGLTWGVLAGVAGGLASAWALRFAGSRKWIQPLWRPVVAVAGAILSYGLAVRFGGSGFVAAFVGGLTFRMAVGPSAPEEVELADELSEMLGALTFLLFGLMVLGPALHELDWQVVLYAVLSLTAIRMIPVAVSLVGSGLPAPAVGLVGWFGPRGLASIVFALVAIEEVDLPHGALVTEVTAITVAASIVLHGVTANPLVDGFVSWQQRQPADVAGG